MLVGLVSSLSRCIQVLARRVQRAISSYLKPTSSTVGSAIDVVRSRSELVVENALLRHQLIVLKRQVKRPKLTSLDRVVMLWLTSHLRGWQQALLLVKPATMLRWHRELFKWLWRRKSQHTGGKAPLSQKLVVIIKQMARENPLWGAEHIRGELLKLGIHVSKSTIQRYLPKRKRTSAAQTWTTFFAQSGHARGNAG